MLVENTNRPKGAALLVVLVLFVSISVGTVSIGQDTIIEQNTNNVEIIAEEDFNVSELSVYDDATQFGKTNLSIPHSNSALINANITEFNSGALPGETLTNFSANASSGEDMTFEFSNLTRRMYYKIYVDGLGYQESSSGDSGDYSYTINDADSSAFRNIELRAEQQDTFSHSTSFSGSSPYGPNSSLNITGSGTYQISGDPVVGGNIDVLQNGQLVNSTITDGTGNYNLNLLTPKVAGTHQYNVNMSQHHLYDDVTTRDITVDSLFIEEGNVESVHTGENIIDIDTDGALNISAKVYKDLDGEIDKVGWYLLEGPTLDDGIVSSSFDPWATLDNNRDPSKTGVWSNTTPQLNKQGIDVGTYYVMIYADSTSGKKTRDEDQPTFKIDIKDLKMNLNLDQESYSINNDDYVNVSGQVIRRPDGDKVNDTNVTIEVVDNETGSSFTAADNVTTNSTGHYEYEYPLGSETGTARLRATTEDEVGIDGNSSKVFTITELTVENINFFDSSSKHSYNISSVVSDNRGISNHQCSLTVSDQAGNSEVYDMSIDTDYGSSNQALCEAPFVDYRNNTNWSSTELLDARVEVENGSSYAAKTKSRNLPNAIPEVKSYTIDEIEKKYAADISAVAKDPNKGSEELQKCKVYYYNNEGEEFVRPGDLDTTYGTEDEARCSYNINSTLEGLGTSENVTANVEFIDKQGSSNISTNKTTLLEATLSFEAEIRDLSGVGDGAVIEFYEPDTGNIVNTLQSDSAVVTGTVPKGVYNMNIKTLGSQIQYNYAEIDGDTQFELSATPNIEEEYNDGISQEWPRNIAHIALDEISIPYSNVTVRFNYTGNDVKERYLTPWECKEWNEDAGYRECRQDDFPREKLDYNPANDYDLNPQEKMVSINTESSEGSYVLASNKGWLQDWFYRKEITVKGGSEDVRDYQVKFNVDTKEMILNGNLDVDCNSIRFYNTDQTVELDHWMKPGTCNSESTEFWVEMPYIPGGTERSIMMYYGDKGLQSTSSGEKTFIEFDEFDTNTLDNYDTNGVVSVENSKLKLDSKDSTISSAEYINQGIEKPYRTHSTLEFDPEADVTGISTYVDGKDSITYNIIDGVFNESFTDNSTSGSISTENRFEINQSVTSDIQRLSVEPAGKNLSLSGNIPDGVYNPLKISTTNSGTAYKGIDVERWFSTNYIESEPVIVDKKSSRLWNLYLNGVNDDLNVNFNTSVDIKLNSSDYKSELAIYRDNELIADSEGEGVQSLLYRTNNLTENKTFEIRGRVNSFSEDLIRDLTVGNDSESPQVRINGKERIGKNKINFSYEVKDNYQGAATCDIAIEGDVKQSSRVSLDVNNQWYQDNIYVENSPHGNNEFNISCSDSSGNVAYDTDSYSQDFQAPRIEFTNLQDGQTLWQVKPRIGYKLKDDYTSQIDYNVSYGFNRSKKVNGTASNNTENTAVLPEPGRYEEMDIIIEAKDNYNFTRSNKITIDLNKPIVNLIRPEENNETERTIHNPNKSTNEEVLPETRAQLSNPDATFEFKYTNNQLSQAECRVMVDGNEIDRGIYSTNTVSELNGTLDQGYNKKARVECKTELGNWVSGNSTRQLDVDYTKPDISGIVFEEGNNTAYTEEKEHVVVAFIEDNLMAPRTNGSIYCYDNDGDRRGETKEIVTTTKAPFLDMEGVDDQVAMNHNFAGNFNNETINLTRETYKTGKYCGWGGVDYNTGDEPKNYIEPNFGSLTPGEYNFRLWISDELNNTRETKEYTYKVVKGDSGLSLTSDNRRTNDGIIVKDTSPKIRCSAVTDQVSTSLTRNGLEIGSADDGETVLEDNSVLTPGTYNYQCDTGGNENYTAESLSRTIEVKDEIKGETYISMNGNQTNGSFEYGKEVRLNVSSRAEEIGDPAGSSELYVDGTKVSTPYRKEFAVGNYTVYGNASGSYRFKESNLTRNLEITKASHEMNLTTNISLRNMSSYYDYGLNYSKPFDGTKEVLDVSRGVRPEIRCNTKSTGATTNLTVNGTTVTSTTGDLTTTISTSNIGTGWHTYRCEGLSNNNFIEDSDTLYVRVTKSPPPTFPESDPDYVDGGPGDTVVDRFDFFNSKERDIERETTVDVSCEPNEGMNSNLYFEGDNIGTADVRKMDSTGNYKYTCKTNRTDNYRNVTRVLTYDVMNRTSTELTLNGQKSNITVDQEEEVQIAGESNVSDTLVELWDDRTEEDRFWVENDGLANKTHIFNIPGEHVITANKTEEDDYFGSKDSLKVSVKDVNPPEVEITDPLEGDIWDHNGYYDGNDFGINYRTRDYSEHQCTTQINDSIASGEDPTDYFGVNDKYGYRTGYGEGIKPSGVYTAVVVCEDEFGNKKESDEVQFRLDSEFPSITVNEEDLVETGSPTPEINVTVDDVSKTVDVDFIAGADVARPDDPDVRDYLENGTKLGSETIDSGTREIETDEVAPGLYNVSIRATDEVGHTSFIHDEFQLRVLDNVTFLDPKDSTPDQTSYVNTTNPELSYKFYSEDAPLKCNVQINGNSLYNFTENEDTWVNNTVEELGGEPLDEGAHTWTVACGRNNSDTFVTSADFTVDTTAPSFDWTRVDKSDGHAYTGEPIRFDASANDNYEVDDVSVTTASELTTKRMFCGSDNQCTTEVDLKPGQHHYNYTACDKAGNCETTQTTAYEIIDSSNSMNLYLNGVQDNITITENPLVNITGEFVSPKEGTVYYYKNDSLTGRCSRGDGCTLEETFLKPNGTFKIDAEFYSTSDYTTNRETFWVNAQVPESLFDGYRLKNLPNGKYASLRDRPQFSIVSNGIQNNKDILLGDSLGENLAAQLNIDFKKNIDASNITFGTNWSNRKSYLHIEKSYSEIIRKDILVPRVENTGKVTVCPGAQSLEEVSYTCNNGYNITTGETIGSTTMEEVIVNGQKYYEVRGVSGTGGTEVPSDSDIEDGPGEASVNEINVMDEYQSSLPTEGNLDLDGGNVSSANLSAEQATDNWAGLYGNATGDVVLGTDNIVYSWNATSNVVLAANNTIDWSLIQTATPENIDRYYGMEGASDSATNTLNETTTIEILGQTFTGAPSTKSLNGTEVPLWTTGALSDGETPVIAGKTLNNKSTAFTGEIVNYQMIIPTGGDSIVPYSMYISLE